MAESQIFGAQINVVIKSAIDVSEDHAQALNVLIFALAAAVQGTQVDPDAIIQALEEAISKPMGLQPDGNFETDLKKGMN